MKIKIINKSQHNHPDYATSLSAGVDLRANLKEKMSLQPLQRKLIKTGVHLELPKGYEAQIRPRSGLAYKNGITVLNSPGTIDADYRGEISVLLVNLSNQEFVINDGDRIAQMIIAPYERVGWKDVDSLDKTKRGLGGLGSTGKK